MRAVDDWISSYLVYTEETESPKSYHLWTAISLIAGALQRKTYIQWGHNKIYPNLYVVLVGPSGRTRKSDAIQIGQNIYKELNLPITAENITKEALIRFMKNSVTNYSDRGTIKWQCAVTTFSKELSVFLGNRDITFLSNLTDWYDSHDSWRYETKNQGKDHITGICYNLLGATAQDWLQSMIPLEAIGGGFTSRIIFVVEDKKGKTIALPSFGPEQETLKKALTIDLQKISNVTGEFLFEKAALAEYVTWYEKEDKKLQNGNAPIPDPRFSGYCERRPTHVKKLAMIFAASRSDKTIITLEDFQRARASLESVEPKMPKVFGGIGKASSGEATYMVLEYLIQNRTSTRSTILKKFYRDIDLAVLGQVEQVLQHMKVVDVQYKDGEMYYKYLGES